MLFHHLFQCVRSSDPVSCLVLKATNPLVLEVIGEREGQRTTVRKGDTGVKKSRKRDTGMAMIKTSGCIPHPYISRKKDGPVSFTAFL